MFTVILVILGGFHVGVFYSKIGIDIFNYIDTTEILFSFTDLLIPLMVFLGVCLLSYLLASITPKSKARTIKVIRPMESGESYFDYEVYKNKMKRKHKREVTWALAAVIFVVFLPAHVFFYGNYPKDYSIEMILYIAYAMAMGMTYFASLPAIITKEGSVTSDMSKTTNGIISVLFYVLAYIGFRADRLAQYTVEHQMADVSLQLKDSASIKTDSTLVFYSTTQKYIFLYDRVDSVSTIIPKEDCKRIEFKNRYNPVKMDSKPRPFPPPN